MNDDLKLKQVKIDGQLTWKLKCPQCGVWGELDDDQYHGRISVYHEGCSFHETVNFSAIEKGEV